MGAVIFLIERFFALQLEVNLEQDYLFTAILEDCCGILFCNNDGLSPGLRYSLNQKSSEPKSWSVSNFIEIYITVFRVWKIKPDRLTDMTSFSLIFNSVIILLKDKNEKNKYLSAYFTMA